MATTKGTTLSTPARTTTAAGVAPGAATNFSDEYVDPKDFDRDVRSSDNWVRVGASDLRAARAVMRQLHLDCTGSNDRDVIINQALFLAAFAVENGLKAVIVERHHAALNNAPSGSLPDRLRGHDLADLASAALADIAPADDHERDALKRGQNYTEWLGRYATPVKHREHHSRAAVNAVLLFAAYERLFFRCVEATEYYKRLRLGDASEDAAMHGAECRGLFEVTAGGVDPLPPGRAATTIEMQTYSGYVARITAR
jgi:hypothetical protein